MSKQHEALRLKAYIERRKKSRGLDIENIHGFDCGGDPDEGFQLRLSDIEWSLALIEDKKQALKSIDARFTECAMNSSISASDAYDSLYQDEVLCVIAKAEGKQ